MAKKKAPKVTPKKKALTPKKVTPKKVTAPKPTVKTPPVKPPAPAPMPKPVPVTPTPTPAPVASRPNYIGLAVGLGLVLLVAATVLFTATRPAAPAKPTATTTLPTNTRPAATATSIAPTATAEPTIQPTATAIIAALTPTVTPTKKTATDENNVVVNGVVMGVVDPQMPKTHAAAIYLPTGISGENTWAIQVPENGTLIVGGVEVNGVDGGIYKAWEGGQVVTVTVTNGFALVTLPQWAEWEFNFRVNEAVKYCWAHKNVEPLDGWKVNITETATCGTGATNGTRIATGQDKTARFNKGDVVWGWKIVLSNGKTCDGGNCYLDSAPTAGTLTSGVINPWSGEVPASVKAKPWQP